MLPKHDLSGLEEFVNDLIVIELTVKKSVVETSEAKASADKPKVVRKNNGAPIIEDWVSDSEEEDMPQAKKEKKTVKSSFAKIKFVKSKEQYDCDYHQRQFNNKKMVKPVWNYTQRVNHQNFSRMTHPSPKRNMVPKAVLMRSGLVSLTTARPVNTAQPRTIRVNTVSGKNVNTARPKAVVNTARPKAVLNAVKGNQVNAVKASACWVWKPKTKVIDHVSKHNSASTILKRFDYIDAQGRSKVHVYLTDFEEINGGYVAFGGNPKGGKITGRGSGPNWLFDIDALTKSMNYKPVVVGNQSTGNACTKACNDVGKARRETVLGKDYILLPLWPANPLLSQNSKSSPDAGFKPSGDNEKKVTKEPGKEGGDSSNDQEKEDDNVNITNNVNTACDGNNTNNVNVVSSTVNATGIEVNDVGAKTSIKLLDDPNMPELEDIVYSDDAEDVGAKADMNNLNTFMLVSPIPTTRIHKDHPVEQIVRFMKSVDGFIIRLYFV
ncbi:hypothetical protein Tco_1448290 [Tanacetum coccineum]